MTTIAEEVAELRALPAAELTKRYVEVFGREPRIRHRAYLWKRLAWKAQEARLGGLSEVAKARLEELIGQLDLPLQERNRTVSGRLRGGRRAGQKLGTTLTREWRGQQISVTIVEGGFEHGGVVYKSLSAVAKVVTGSHWNGRLFFNLRQRTSKASA